MATYFDVESAVDAERFAAKQHQVHMAVYVGVVALVLGIVLALGLLLA